MEYLLQLIFAAIHLGGVLLYLFGLPAAVIIVLITLAESWQFRRWRGIAAIMLGVLVLMAIPVISPFVGINTTITIVTAAIIAMALRVLQKSPAKRKTLILCGGTLLMASLTLAAIAFDNGLDSKGLLALPVFAFIVMLPAIVARLILRNMRLT